MDKHCKWNERIGKRENHEILLKITMKLIHRKLFYASNSQHLMKNHRKDYVSLKIKEAAIDWLFDSKCIKIIAMKIRYTYL